MDIQMPFMDGKETTRRLRQLGLKIPIVALTAHALEEEKQSCLEAGCNGQITKPVTYEELVDGVHNYLEGACA
jgi:CheY-like chemotaxis protein